MLTKSNKIVLTIHYLISIIMFIIYLHMVFVFLTSKNLFLFLIGIFALVTVILFIKIAIFLSIEYFNYMKNRENTTYISSILSIIYIPINISLIKDNIIIHNNKMITLYSLILLLLILQLTLFLIIFIKNKAKE